MNAAYPAAQCEQAANEAANSARLAVCTGSICENQALVSLMKFIRDN